MTTQIPDAILFQGIYYELSDEPLEALFEHEAQQLHGRYAFGAAAGWKKIKRPEFKRGVGSSDCWRDYVGEWIIEDDRLYLKELHGLDGSSLRGLVFPDGDGPIHMAWLSGTMRLRARMGTDGRWRDYRPWPLDQLVEVVAYHPTTPPKEILIKIQHGMAVEVIEAPGG